MKRLIASLVFLTTAFVIAIAASGCSLPVRAPFQVQLPPEVAQEALEAALTRVGDAYVWGGQSPGGFDCSGLVIWAYSQAYPGLRLRHESELVDDATMDVLFRWNILRVRPEEMIPGDIVFITDSHERVTHGGLFIRWVTEFSEFEFVNASSYFESPEEHGRVVIDSWPIEGVKRGQWFVGAGRMLTSY